MEQSGVTAPKQTHYPFEGGEEPNIWKGLLEKKEIHATNAQAENGSRRQGDFMRSASLSDSKDCLGIQCQGCHQLCISGILPKNFLDVTTL